jgi:hypothetical protein
VSSQHKKPILAFVVLAVMAAAVVGNQFHARADGSRFISAGPLAAHSDAPGAESVPAPTGNRAGATPSGPRLDGPRRGTGDAAAAGPGTILTDGVNVVATGGNRADAGGADDLRHQAARRPGPSRGEHRGHHERDHKIRDNVHQQRSAPGRSSGRAHGRSTGRGAAGSHSSHPLPRGHAEPPGHARARAGGGSQGRPAAS